MNADVRMDAITPSCLPPPPQGWEAEGGDPQGVTGGLAVGAAGTILSGVALLCMPPGDLRLSQSQQLAVQGPELGAWARPQVTTERGVA